MWHLIPSQLHTYKSLPSIHEPVLVSPLSLLDNGPVDLSFATNSRNNKRIVGLALLYMIMPFKRRACGSTCSLLVAKQRFLKLFLTAKGEYVTCCTALVISKESRQLVLTRARNIHVPAIRHCLQEFAVSHIAQARALPTAPSSLAGYVTYRLLEWQRIHIPVRLPYFVLPYDI